MQQKATPDSETNIAPLLDDYVAGLLDLDRSSEVKDMEEHS